MISSRRSLIGVLAAYIDDVKTQASAALTEEIIDTQIRDGPAYGAFLKMEKHRILLEVCATDAAASTLQSHFHTKYAIPRNRIIIHPDSIADPLSKVEGRLLYGDVILGIPASPFPEFISAFVQVEISWISSEWRVASDRLKDEPHYLSYLFRHILGSKFTYLFRGIAPELSQLSRLRSNNMFNTIYQSGKSIEARAWLDAIPKSEAQTMLPSEFRTAFQNRLLIHYPQLLAHTTCSCGKVVDPYGIRIQKCRRDGNLTNATHNNLVACLAEMIRHCGQSVRVEVSGIFSNVDPSGNQRMDLVVFDPGRPNSLYDVVVTNTGS